MCVVHFTLVSEKYNTVFKRKKTLKHKIKKDKNLTRSNFTAKYAAIDLSLTIYRAGLVTGTTSFSSEKCSLTVRSPCNELLKLLQR